MGLPGETHEDLPPLEVVVVEYYLRLYYSYWDEKPSDGSKDGANEVEHNGDVGGYQSEQKEKQQQASSGEVDPSRGETHVRISDQEAQRLDLLKYFHSIDDVEGDAEHRVEHHYKLEAVEDRVCQVVVEGYLPQVVSPVYQVVGDAEDHEEEAGEDQGNPDVVGHGRLVLSLSSN